MNAPLLVIALPVVGYFVGAIPVAWLICRWVTGKDMRSLGSGNVGVMNTALSVTRWGGLLVFASEITKGVLAVIIPRILISGNLTDAVVSMTIVAVVVGTRWPVWLRFHGGRGNTAGLSALIMISWKIGVLLIGIWILMRLLTEKSFIATRLALVVMPIIVWLVTQTWWYVFASGVLSLIYIGAQKHKTDDHLILKENWPSLWAFLLSPPRRE